MTKKRRPAPAPWSQLELPPIPLLDLDPPTIRLDPPPDLNAPIRLDQTAPPRTRRRKPRP